tara:strand:- start:492 stop:614 length:123 start_codon:yes stop_codon:yes gene_type:complete
MKDILIKKMLMGDKSAEQKLIREYGLTENDIAKIKKYRYL